ncbi:TPA: hypothetical protein ACI78C_001720 [Streptococcus pyogenes]|uniref:hypothetical protein n=1 Tax=Streptococcus pyogenes TaxID=1314 RepID=UPI000DA3A730|nr:hypothetical protein [Streptococcus pyogenes]SQF61573.1 Uncharacterised protein [Streptococcus pyogenes]HEP1509796.1 hypothetical protein [Streptococcus pyogenes]HER1315797.1 hypothetical protein [Streptococcus pyogenes]HER2582355.1 hypothetical protein [Streptococcus pyogenes]HER2939100.1 hypothetical protein [Streptococcus pyogenes]
MKISNSKDLALAIVASSGPTLSIEDKIKLYEDSVEAIKQHNLPFVEAEKQEQINNGKVIAEALERGESLFG